MAKRFFRVRCSVHATLLDHRTLFFFSFVPYRERLKLYLKA